MDSSVSVLTKYQLELNFTNATSPISTEPAHLVLMRGIIMFGIIFGALFGNALVVLSVLRFRSIRSVITNYFILSLALADFLVALLVMPFNALQNLLGRWIFGRLVCDNFNANDVLFSTASIIHLCCISMDRYIAIMQPLVYDIKMNRKRVGAMLAVCWIAPLLISYIPIHTGIYTKPEYLRKRKDDDCTFRVNPSYAIISSTVSFWIPCFVMCFVYGRIFVEARKQEQKFHRMQKMLIEAANKRLTADSENNHEVQPATSPSRLSSSNPFKKSPLLPKKDSQVNENQGRETNIHREHKAAKTLGIIMGCFFLCWLPFFIWYTFSNIFNIPDDNFGILIDILFWIGYFNSTLNPIIYAFCNREFRTAFSKLLHCRRTESHSLTSTARRSTNFNSYPMYRESD